MKTGQKQWIQTLQVTSAAVCVSRLFCACHLVLTGCENPSGVVTLALGTPCHYWLESERESVGLKVLGFFPATAESREFKAEDTPQALFPPLAVRVSVSITSLFS